MLLTPEEGRRYGRLETAEARRLFVHRFWARLDPDPSTARNEFRETFEARAGEALRRFGEGVVPGWATDRGRAFLLLGEPDEIRREEPSWEGHGREIWAWSSARTGGAPLEVTFHRSSDGRLRLTQDREETPSGLRDEDLEAEWRRALRAGPVATSELAFRLAERTWRGGTSGFLPPWPVLPDVLPGVEPLPPGPQGTGGLREGVWFFKARDGSVLALFALDPGIAPEVEARAWLWPSDSPRGPQAARPVPLVAREGLRAGQAWMEPGGDYEVRWSVEDKARSTRTVRSSLVAAPDLGRDGLVASSVVPAERFGPAASPDTPFAVGSEEVVPRPDAVFRRGETLRLYFQVYGASEDPRTGETTIDVRFRFERRSRARWHRQGRPLEVRGARGASMGVALPVGDWPAGEYRVRVDLRDRVSGSAATTGGAFRIVDG